MMSSASWAAGELACPVTVGALTLNVTQPRTSGISPFLAFFDATATTTTATLGGAGTVMQDVYFNWNFGDTGVSGGSATWGNGASGQTLRNAATGIIAAHLYVLSINSTADATYTVKLSAKVIDATTQVTTVATCVVTATALAPSGVNGFPNANTTCVAANSTPVAGAGGCPAGAAVLPSQSNLGTALTSAFGNGKRVLFKCGDTFNGAFTFPTFTKATIGAYGGCENTLTSRPIFQNSSGTTLQFNQTTAITNTDLRLTDIDFEDGTTSAKATGNGGGLGGTQITFYNLKCIALQYCYTMNQATQSGVIASTADVSAHGTGWYALFWNYAENNCLNNSTAANCGGTPAYAPVNYNAIMGNNLTGTSCVYNGGANGCTGAEVTRFSACRLCVVTNNKFFNSSGSWGATLKMHSGNTFNSLATFIGQYSEYLEVSDNVFSGLSGANLVEFTPQNTTTDERLRLVVFERNMMIGATGNAGGPGNLLWMSASNGTVRNNVFFVTAADTTPPGRGSQFLQRGIEPVPQGNEIYNNTCYFLTTVGPCVQFGGSGGSTAAQNGFASNNLLYNNGVNVGGVSNGGTGNTVSNNTTDGSVNPNMKNGSGNFSLLGDFLPQPSVTGALCTVPNYFDAFQFSRAGNGCRLGALSPAAP